MKIIAFLAALSFLVNSTPAQATVEIAGVTITLIKNDTEKPYLTSRSHYLKYVRYMTVSQETSSMMTDEGGTSPHATWQLGDAEMNNAEDVISEDVVRKVFALEARPENARRRIIVNQMLMEQSGAAFQFCDVEHARATVTQRLKSVNLMAHFNRDQIRYQSLQGIAGTFDYPAGNANTNAEKWEKCPANDAVGKLSYRQKRGDGFEGPDYTPYKAINNLCAPETVTYGECFGALTTCVWWGAAQAMGENKFNQYYQGKKLNMLSRLSYPEFQVPEGETDQCRDLLWNSWVPGKYDNQVLAGGDNKVLVIGDMVYFRNYNYQDLHRQPHFTKVGINLSANALGSGENTFVADVINPDINSINPGSYNNYIFGGLGGSMGDLALWYKNKEDMQMELKLIYNRDLQRLWDWMAYWKGKPADERPIWPIPHPEDGRFYRFNGTHIWYKTPTGVLRADPLTPMDDNLARAFVQLFGLRQYHKGACNP